MEAVGVAAAVEVVVVEVVEEVGQQAGAVAVALSQVVQGLTPTATETPSCIQGEGPIASTGCNPTVSATLALHSVATAS